MMGGALEGVVLLNEAIRFATVIPFATLKKIASA